MLTIVPAVDAVTSELSGSTTDVGGLNVSDDERAIAGYVTAGPGTVSASVEFDYYSGAQRADAKEAPHVGLFVYDAATPAPHGEPTVLARAQGLQGSAAASVASDRDVGDQTLFVVANLANLPARSTVPTRRQTATALSPSRTTCSPTGRGTTRTRSLARRPRSETTTPTIYHT